MVPRGHPIHKGHLKVDADAPEALSVSFSFVRAAYAPVRAEVSTLSWPSCPTLTARVCGSPSLGRKPQGLLGDQRESARTNFSPGPDPLAFQPLESGLLRPELDSGTGQFSPNPKSPES